MKRWSLGLGIALVIAALAWFTYDAVLGTNAFSESKSISIPLGAHASTVADSLQRAGVIRSRSLFLLALRLTGKELEIHPGTYDVPPHASNRDVILIITHSHGGRHLEVTVPEGLTATAIAHIVASRLGCDSARFMAYVHDTVLIRALGIRGRSLEGYLLPETYAYDPPVQERDVVVRMVHGMDKFLDDSLRERIASLGVSESQALALASIVEGEAVADSERPRIAGVYWNRLRLHMKMEADPTIQYIIGSPRRLTYDDLRIESPYNTYLHTGLPPTPINNPGRRAILATLNPEKHHYIFFVAKGDGSRTHRFSRTMEEHQRAVAQYRRDRMANK